MSQRYVDYVEPASQLNHTFLGQTLSSEQLNI